MRERVLKLSRNTQICARTFSEKRMEQTQQQQLNNREISNEKRSLFFAKKSIICSRFNSVFWIYGFFASKFPFEVKERREEYDCISFTSLTKSIFKTYNIHFIQHFIILGFVCVCVFASIIMHIDIMRESIVAAIDAVSVAAIRDIPKSR